MAESSNTFELGRSTTWSASAARRAKRRRRRRVTLCNRRKQQLRALGRYSIDGSRPVTILRGDVKEQRLIRRLRFEQRRAAESIDTQRGLILDFDSEHS